MSGGKRESGMNTIVVDYTNFKREHLCCVLRDRNGEGRIEAKRRWLENVFEDGLVLRKGDVNGRAFMEYVPAEDAWCPVDAPGYMFIHCYRIDDKFRGQGYDTAIWRECVAECRIKHKKGLCVLVGEHDLPNLNRKSDFEARGFRFAAKAEPYFELWYLPLEEDAEPPRFSADLTEAEVEREGWALYYSHQCPHTAKLVPRLEAKAKELNIPLKTVLLEKTAEYRAVPRIPCAYTTFALFYNGAFVTHEMLSPARFGKLLSEHSKK